MTTQADSVRALGKSLDSTAAFTIPGTALQARRARSGERCKGCGARARLVIQAEDEELYSCCNTSELRALLRQGLTPCHGHADPEARHMSEHERSMLHLSDVDAKRSDIAPANHERTVGRFSD